MATQQRGEETRNRILDAALEAFALYGYDAASVSGICRRADVTKGGFYHHFASKQSLFLEMLQRWLEELDGQLTAARLGAATIPDEFLRMMGMIKQVFRDAEGRLSIFLEFLTKAGHDPVVWEMTIAPFRRYHAFFAQMIQEGIAEGSLRSVNPDLATHVLLSFAVGLLVLGLLDPQATDWGQVGHNGLQLLLDGLGENQ
jgi:AcrR family transcriptional regulator